MSNTISNKHTQSNTISHTHTHTLLQRPPVCEVTNYFPLIDFCWHLWRPQKTDIFTMYAVCFVLTKLIQFLTQTINSNISTIIHLITLCCDQFAKHTSFHDLSIALAVNRCLHSVTISLDNYPINKHWDHTGRRGRGLGREELSESGVFGQVLNEAVIMYALTGSGFKTYKSNWAALSLGFLLGHARTCETWQGRKEGEERRGEEGRGDAIRGAEKVREGKLEKWSSRFSSVKLGGVNSETHMAPRAAISVGVCVCVCVCV